MGLILTKPARIGDAMRMPGYELTEEDMKGRSIDQMDRLGYVAYVDSRDAGSAGSSKPRRKVSSDAGSAGE